MKQEGIAGIAYPWFVRVQRQFWVVFQVLAIQNILCTYACTL